MREFKEQSRITPYGMHEELEDHEPLNPCASNSKTVSLRCDEGGIIG